MNRGCLHILSFLCLGALSAACTKTDPGGSAPAVAVVHINASINDAAVLTKATSPFVDGTNYGIFACVSGSDDYEMFKPSLYNVRANKRAVNGTGGYNYPNGWSYNYIYTGAGQAPGTPETDERHGANTFVLSQRKDDKTADLYAYAPWVREAYLSGPRAIPFELSRQLDLMYARQNTTNGNGGLDPQSGPLAASFTFEHAYAKVIIRFRLRNPDSRYYVSLDSITRSDDAAPTVELWTAGDFDAVTGTFVDNAHKQTTSSLPVNAGATVASTAFNVHATMSFYLVPTEITKDDELTFHFTSDGVPLQPFSLKKGYVMHDDGVTCGFQPGYTYTLDFMLDNYLFFNGFNVSTAWEDDVRLGDGENI